MKDNGHSTPEPEASVHVEETTHRSRPLLRAVREGEPASYQVEGGGSVRRPIPYDALIVTTDGESFLVPVAEVVAELRNLGLCLPPGPGPRRKVKRVS